MKVLYITNHYPNDKQPDYGVFTRDQIEACKNKGIKSDIIFINAREHGFKAYLDSIRLIKQKYKDYDIIHCFHGLCLITTFFSTRKKPILVSFLNAIQYESYTGSNFINFFFVSIYNFIVKSKRVYAIYKDKLPMNKKTKNRSFYLPNGVDLNYFKPIKKEIAKSKLGLSIDTNYILFVSSKEKGRLQKRYDIFSKTLEILKNKYPEKNFEELIMSKVPRNDCIYFFNSSECHLLTSDFEGSPNSVKEAMSCNIPVISTNVGNVKEMIKNAPNCFIVEQDPQKISEKVIEVISLPRVELRDVLKKNKLTVEDKTQELISIYHTIINGKTNT